jgi:hypothetical protein
MCELHPNKTQQQQGQALADGSLSTGTSGPTNQEARANENPEQGLRKNQAGRGDKEA